MNKKNLRKNLDELILIFLHVKYYELDFKYIHSVKNTLPELYHTYNLFIDRVYHSASVVMTLNLCKLFDEREKSGLVKFKNKLLQNYNRSELKDSMPLNELNVLFESLFSDDVLKIMKKIKDTRDKYYAHLDPTRMDFSEIRITSADTEILVSKAEFFIRTIELKYFDADKDFSLTINELGHNIFERLDFLENDRIQKASRMYQ